MAVMKKEYIEKIYAGWLAKIIGIRLGAPVEGWSYEQIKNIYGDLAAEFAKKAASVTHGGNGVYGGMFVASCISYAFAEQDIRKIIEKGLSYIPSDCEYAKVVRAVIAYYEKYPEKWEDCYHFIYENYGYDKYPGVCHIIPNSAVMILALLYGNGDFSDTLNICNRCGWDTDCNVGNVAAVMGVRGGLQAIDYNRRKYLSI